MVRLYRSCLPYAAGLMQNNPPLSGTFSSFNFLPFPSTELSLRLFPCIFMATSCALIANFFYRMGSTGLIALSIALLFASNRYTIFYSRRARSISLGVMLLICLVFMIERFLSDKKYREFSFQFVGVLLLALLSLGLQPVGVGIAFGIFSLFFLKDRKQMILILALLVVTAGLFLPFQLSLIEALPKSNVGFEFSHISNFFYSFRSGFIVEVLAVYLAIPFALIFFFSLFLLIVSKSTKEKKEIISWIKKPSSIFYLCLLFTFMFLIIPIFDFFSNGAITAHYVYFLWPISILLLGNCLSFCFGQKSLMSLKSVKIGFFIASIGLFFYQWNRADIRERSYPDFRSAMQSVLEDKSFKAPYLFSHLCVLGSEYWCPDLPVYSDFYFRERFGKNFSNPFVLDRNIPQFFRSIFQNKISVDNMYFLFFSIDPEMRSEIRNQFIGAFGNRADFIYEDSSFLVLKISAFQNDARADLMKVLQTARNVCQTSSKFCFWNEKLIVAAYAGLGKMDAAQELFAQMKENSNEVAIIAWKNYHFDPELREVEGVITGHFEKYPSCN